MFNLTCKKYHGCLTVNGDEIQSLVIHFRPYHVEFDPIQDIRAALFVKTFGAKFLLSIDFHMILLTVFDDV